MDRSVGPYAPGPRHLGAALLRRRVALLLLAVFATLALLPVAAVASGQDILSDFEDNGQIDECYTRQEFQQALKLARADERVYGNAVDALEEAQVTNVARPGEECDATAGTNGEGDDGGVGIGVWIGLAVAVGLVAAGAGAWARRSGPGDGSE
ncbi:MAG: hypothetical protein QOD86_2682 [Miltoncostaeaceae bacterium]|jgi:hypothetical protein|nr:hypothetical protein [Miltoncostaeaceae bacterium]